MGILCYDTGLVWLSYISENNIYHSNDESIIQRFSCVMDDWDNIGSLFSHIDEISTDSMGELNCIYNTLWTNNIWNMGNSGSWSSPQIKYFRSWFNASFGDASNDRSRNFRSIWIPNTILNFFSINFNTNSFLIINTLSWH